MNIVRGLEAARGVLTPGHQRAVARFKATKGRSHCTRRKVLPITDKLVLVPTGSGNTDHLEEPVPVPDEIELKEGVFEVGREEPADVVIPVPTVSGRHALLRIKESKVQVTDLGSTNGTYLDEEELPTNRAVDVPLGSRIVFGDAALAMFELVERPDDVQDVAEDTAAENVVSA